jgi:hypothetical protein
MAIRSRRPVGLAANAASDAEMNKRKKADR